MLIRYLLDFVLRLSTLNDVTWNLVIPFILSAVPILTRFRIRTRIIKVKGDREKGLSLFQFIAWGTMAAVLCQSQLLVEALNQRLTRVQSVEQLESVTDFSHVRFSELEVDTTRPGFSASSHSSGKYNQYLDHHLCFVFPVMRKALIGYEQHAIVRVAVQFYKRADNRASDAVRKIEHDKFWEESWNKIQSYRFDEADHFRRVPHSERLSRFRSAARQADVDANVDQFIFLEPVYAPYPGKVGIRLFWTFASLLGGMIVMSVFLAISGLQQAEFRRQLRGAKPARGDVDDMLRFFVPKGDHFVSSLLLDLLLLVYLLMATSGENFFTIGSHELMKWGALRRPEVLDGEWWRLLTAVFLHGGVFHLVSNAIGLMVGGSVLEPLLGRKRFFAIFLISAVAGSIFNIAWHERTVSGGASGAILGLFGALLALALTKKFSSGENRFVLTFAGIFAGISLLVGLTGGIDNAANIGGLTGGAVAGLMLYKPMPHEAA